MSEKIIRVGVAGAGFIGAVHARAYQRIPGVELVGVADPVMQKAESVARETVCQAYSDYSDLLKAGVDVISVALPPELHLPAAKEAAAAGVHIMMEKPITRTVEEAAEMVEVCKRAGVYLMTGFTHHFYPEMREAKRIVSSGVIGKPLTALDAMSISYAFVLPWYRDKEIAGGGVMMCNAVHGLDRVSWVIGQKVSSICAIVEPTTGTKGEDFGSALAMFDGGTQGTFYQHWGPYHTLVCEMHIYGEEGMVRVRSWDSIEVLSGGKVSIHKPYYPEHGLVDRTMMGMVSQMTEMIEAVREGRQPEPTGEDGRHSIALVQAAYESSERRAWVDVR